MIGETVKVIVDRPIGSVHPKHKNIVYKVNYGFVPRIFAADGEEQDAYVLGVKEPLCEFTGRVVAVIHRLNDAEDKWVVAPENISFTADEIWELVKFQEQYFEVEILTK